VGVNLPRYSCSCTLHSLVETDISARKLKIYSDEWFDWPTPPNAFLIGESPTSILQAIMCSISINLVLCVCHLFRSKGFCVLCCCVMGFLPSLALWSSYLHVCIQAGTMPCLSKN
jgi:hypothetical protein